MLKSLERIISISILTCVLFDYVNSTLHCIQCGNNEAWYSEEEHERRIEACRLGAIEPTPCTNSSHTHCIVNWYRTGGTSQKIVTQRQCGILSDATGCTLYNSKISRKIRRHLLSRDDNGSNLRRETVVSFVEVCSTACRDHEECVNIGSLISTYLPTLLLTIIFSIFM